MILMEVTWKCRVSLWLTPSYCPVVKSSFSSVIGCRDETLFTPCCFAAPEIYCSDNCVTYL